MIDIHRLIETAKQYDVVVDTEAAEMIDRYCEAVRETNEQFNLTAITDPDEMEETGFFDFVNGDGVTLIEWAELIEDVIPKDAMWVTIEKDTEKGFDYRKITVR